MGQPLPPRQDTTKVVTRLKIRLRNFDLEGFRELLWGRNSPQILPLPWNPFIFADTVWPLFIFDRYSWYCQEKNYFRYIFEADTPQPAGGSLLFNPLTTLFLSTWMTNWGRQAYWWTALEEEVAGEVAASPRGSSKPSRPAYFSILFTHFKDFR